MVAARLAGEGVRVARLWCGYARLALSLTYLVLYLNEVSGSNRTFPTSRKKQTGRAVGLSGVPVWTLLLSTINSTVVVPVSARVHIRET